jgi:ectoine hydroxylase-related dioxygenase (phytanoyl-CoA dioxygenase family)
MSRGDVLFFHSLLLHSGQVNFTDRVRYSVQARFEPL